MQAIEQLLKQATTLYYQASPVSPEDEAYTSALKVLARVEREAPGDRRVYRLRWHIRYLRKDYAGALADLNKALDGQLSGALLYNRALVHTRLGDDAKAKHDLKQALVLAQEQHDDDLIDAIEHHITPDLDRL
ncbi:MAG: hypothetical protein RhofKO_43400 [Rhodothermales bacterium]